MIDLKNCPICNRQPIVQVKAFGLSKKNVKARVMCHLCGKKTGWYRTNEGWGKVVFEAIDAWNRG